MVVKGLDLEVFKGYKKGDTRILLVRICRCPSFEYKSGPQYELYTDARERVKLGDLVYVETHYGRAKEVGWVEALDYLDASIFEGLREPLGIPAVKVKCGYKTFEIAHINDVESYKLVDWFEFDGLEQDFSEMTEEVLKQEVTAPPNRELEITLISKLADMVSELSDLIEYLRVLVSKDDQSDS